MSQAVAGGCRPVLADALVNGSLCPSHPSPALPLPLLCLLPRPAWYKRGSWGREWGAGGMSAPCTGVLVPWGLTRTPSRDTLALEVPVPPASTPTLLGTGRFAVILHLTHCFSVSLSPFTTGEVMCSRNSH